jgi:hypothetical protein
MITAQKFEELSKKRSFNSRAGIVGLNFPVGVSRHEIKVAAKVTNNRSITYLAAALMLVPCPKEAFEEDVDGDMVHVAVPLQNWAAWVRVHGKNSVKKMGQALTYWTRKQNVEEGEDPWHNPWQEIVALSDLKE